MMLREQQEAEPLRPLPMNNPFAVAYRSNEDRKEFGEVIPLRDTRAHSKFASDGHEASLLRAGVDEGLWAAEDVLLKGDNRAVSTNLWDETYRCLHLNQPDETLEQNKSHHSLPHVQREWRPTLVGGVHRFFAFRLSSQPLPITIRATPLPDAETEHSNGVKVPNLCSPVIYASAEFETPCANRYVGVDGCPSD